MVKWKGKESTWPIHISHHTTPHICHIIDWLKCVRSSNCILMFVVCDDWLISQFSISHFYSHFSRLYLGRAHSCWSCHRVTPFLHLTPLWLRPLPGPDWLPAWALPPSFPRGGGGRGAGWWDAPAPVIIVQLECLNNCWMCVTLFTHHMWSPHRCQVVIPHSWFECLSRSNR